MLLLAWWQRREPAATRRRSGLLVLAFLAAAQALLGLALAGAVAWLQLFLTATPGGMAAWLAYLLIGWRARFNPMPWLVARALAAGWFDAALTPLAALFRPVAASASASSLTPLHLLPLSPSGGGETASVLATGGRRRSARAAA